MQAIRAWGRGAKATPIRLSRDSQVLLGLVRASWEDLAPHLQARMAYMEYGFGGWLVGSTPNPRAEVLHLAQTSEPSRGNVGT